MTDTPKINLGDVLHEAATGLRWRVVQIVQDPDRGPIYWCISTVGAYNRKWSDADLAPRVTIARRAEPDEPPPALLSLLDIESAINAHRTL